MDKAKLNTIRTIARCEAIYRSRTEKDRCLIGSDHFNAMYDEVFDVYVLKEFEKLKAQITDLSWDNNPDRSGGQFTSEEINRDTW